MNSIKDYEEFIEKHGKVGFKGTSNFYTFDYKDTIADLKDLSQFHDFRPYVHVIDTKIDRLNGRINSIGGLNLHKLPTDVREIYLDTLDYLHEKYSDRGVKYGQVSSSDIKKIHPQLFKAYRHYNTLDVGRLRRHDGRDQVRSMSQFQIESHNGSSNKSIHDKFYKVGK